MTEKERDLNIDTIRKYKKAERRWTIAIIFQVGALVLQLIGLLRQLLN